MVELFPCQTKAQLLARERHHIEQLGATLNKCIPSRTPEQYREENSEAIAEKAGAARRKDQLAKAILRGAQRRNQREEKKASRMRMWR